MRGTRMPKWEQKRQASLVKAPLDARLCDPGQHGWHTVSLGESLAAKSCQFERCSRCSAVRLTMYDPSYTPKIRRGSVTVSRAGKVVAGDVAPVGERARLLELRDRMLAILNAPPLKMPWYDKVAEARALLMREVQV